MVRYMLGTNPSLDWVASMISFATPVAASLDTGVSPILYSAVLVNSFWVEEGKATFYSARLICINGMDSPPLNANAVVLTN